METDVVRVRSRTRREEEESTRKFVVRLPLSVHQQLAEESRKKRRSMNSEIVARLERGLPLFHRSEFELHEPDSVPEQVLTSSLHADELVLLTCFRSLPEEKQEALLKLIR